LGRLHVALVPGVTYWECHTRVVPGRLFVRKRAVIVGVALVGIAVVAGCTGASERPDSVVATSGWLRLGRGPLAPRDGPVVVVAAHEVMVFGGYETRRGRLHPFGDGAVFDLKEAEWRRLPKSPFKRAPYPIGAVWTGQELVVLGTPCGETAPAEESTDCGGRRLDGARFGPARRSWLRIRLPAGLSTPASTGPVIPRGIGWTGELAVFSLATGLTVRFAGFDPKMQRWRMLPGLDRDITRLCPGRDAIFGFSTSASPASGLSGSGPINRLRAARLAANGSGWSDVDEIDVPGAGQAEFAFRCAANTVVYQAGPVQGSQQVVWFDTNRPRWTVTPSPPLERFDSGITAARTEHFRVLWPTRSSASNVLVLPDGRSEWVRVAEPATPQEPVELLPLADGRLIVVPSVRGFTLSVFDPQQAIGATR
jgi:hypothetical protein